MKIGILTLRLHKNYGGILQNYALSLALKKLGYDVETINIVWDIRIPKPKRYLVYLKRILLYWKNRTPIFLEENILKEDVFTTKYTKEFKESKITLTDKVYYMPHAIFNDLDSKYDAIVVGSDQVWRPKYTMGIKRYFLDFITDSKTRKISYAASFGTDSNEYSNKEREECGNLIKDFKAVSVREESAIKLIKEQLQWSCDPKLVLDPTLLLKPEDYKQFIKQKDKQEDSIFVYILDYDEDKRHVVKSIEEQTKLKSKTLTPEGMKNESKSIIPPVEDWLSSIANASFVVTDSFHGCLFSILFNKPFLVYGNNKRGQARFYSVLSMFNLTNRYIDNSEDLNPKILVEDIDWKHINSLIADKREDSYNFLINALTK